MRSRNWPNLFNHFANPKKAEKITTEQPHIADNPEDRAAQEARHIIDQLRSIPGLWEELYAATLIGRPKCLRQINEIAEDSGIIDAKNTQPDDDGNEAKCFTIDSRHHAATQRIGLSSEYSLSLATIIWALEGRSFRR